MYEIFSGLHTPENISYDLSINLRLPFSNLSKGLMHAIHSNGLLYQVRYLLNNAQTTIYEDRPPILSVH